MARTPVLTSVPDDDQAVDIFQAVKNGKTIGAYQRLGIRNDEVGAGR